MRNYRDLQVWTKAHKLTLDLYRLSQTFPREEIYGITSQLRRAAVSIGANLAEGCGRRTSTELARFVRIAMGSASELDYHILLSKDLGFMNSNDFALTSAGLTEVRKMLTSFLISVEEQIELKSKAAGTT
ncbi:MAG TPA: four helix bundle protein [Candidatus Angelobacter sp.]|jgi:four helix bundle protein|nr:four helix bundle protein [Candidatus Angelobacter sp.]